MTKDRFAEILREYGFYEGAIDILWEAPENKNPDTLRELTLRIAATATAAKFPQFIKKEHRRHAKPSV